MHQYVHSLWLVFRDRWSYELRYSYQSASLYSFLFLANLWYSQSRYLIPWETNNLSVPQSGILHFTVLEVYNFWVPTINFYLRVSWVQQSLAREADLHNILNRCTWIRDPSLKLLYWILRNSCVWTIKSSDQSCHDEIYPENQAERSLKLHWHRSLLNLLFILDKLLKILFRTGSLLILI